MPTTRTYGDSCGIARALDVVGERWALLVVRELLLGPQRFTDLRRGLANASSNLIADRLRELEGHAVVRRRKLAPPAGSWVYELTEWARELEPIVLALGTWGVRAPSPPSPATLSASSILIALRSFAQLDPNASATTYRFEIDGGVWTVQASAEHVQVQPGDLEAVDVWVRTDPQTLADLIGDASGLDAAVATGRLVVDGDPQALRRLLERVIVPQAPSSGGAWDATAPARRQAAGSTGSTSRDARSPS